ncbi:MAG: spore coat U domain-containing protein [Acidobacteriia bacterium]|nr:spore coat U domain-containing protein [Terriglobia bacterium]
MKKTFGLAILLLFTASAAFAGTATGNMNVTATVTADCVVNSAADMAFGNLGIPFTINSVDATTSAAINYTCTNSGVAPKIRLDQGLNPGVGSTDAAPVRRMISGGNYISYALFTDAAHSTPWINSAGGGVAGTADGAAHTVTAYGVATAANVPAGAYSDQVVVSVDF